MITDYLQELIICGKAKNVTFNGVGGASVYRMPKGNHAVLHNLIIYPYLDLSEFDDFGNIGQVSLRNLQQCRISSKLSTNHFMFRFDLQQVGDFFIPVNSQNIETWLTHNSDIFFEFLHSPLSSGWGTVAGDLPPVSNNPNKPIVGYGVTGVGLQATARIDYNDVNLTNVRPFNTFSPPPAGSNSFAEFTFPANADTVINTRAPGSDMYNFTFPMFTAQLVLIDGNPGEHFKQSQ